MSNWITYEKNIGEVKVKDRLEIKFKSTESIPIIDEIKASCGCTQPIYDDETKILSVIYTVPKFSKHIKGNTQSINKAINIFYKNGEIDVLYIRGTKIR